MTELNQFLAIGLMGARNERPSRHEGEHDGVPPFRLQDHPYLTPSSAARVRPDFGSKFGVSTRASRSSACVDLAKRQGLDFLVLDQTRPDIEVPVVRVVVPGLRHFYRRFAPGRLYDVPVKLGWRDRPLRKASSIRFTRRPESHPGVRAPGIKRGARAAPTTLAARLAAHVALEPRANGKSSPASWPLSGLGQFSAGATERAQDLRSGLPLRSLSSGGRDIEREVHELVRRLAGHGLLEYRFGTRPEEDAGRDRAAAARLLAAHAAARQHRRSRPVAVRVPATARQRDGAGIAACRRAVQDPQSRGLRAVLASLLRPNGSGRCGGRTVFPGIELLALLARLPDPFQARFRQRSRDATREGDDNLVLWDFHDLLFHARSTEGRHANPLGGVYPYAGVIAPQPAVRPRWRGKQIDLRQSRQRKRRPSRRPQGSCNNGIRHAASTISDRSRLPSLRGFSTAPRVSARDGAAARSRRNQSYDRLRGPALSFGRRGYELELYLAVDKCEGLARGFYHYDAGGHALVPIEVRPHELEALLKGAEFAMGAPAAPQILITIAARFGRCMEVQLDRLCARFEGCRRPDANALPDGDRYGARRLCDRQRQHRSVRADDRDRIPRRGPGRPICPWPRSFERGRKHAWNIALRQAFVDYSPIGRRCKIGNSSLYETGAGECVCGSLRWR